MNFWARKFNSAGALGYLNWMPDKLYLKILFRLRMGYRLNLKKPRTFSEKLQWLKLYDRKPLYTTLVDKAEVKEYVARRIGEQYVIPTLGVWDRFEDIDFDALPDQFVLKCTHDSGGLAICRDKATFDKAKAREKIERSLKVNYFWSAREWPYKNVKPRILAEKYIEVPGKPFLPVYKFFCFNGVARIIQAIQNDKQPNETIDYYDSQWHLLELRQNFPNSDTPTPRPPMLDEMLAVAQKLSQGHRFLRIDLYTVGGEILFSECTFYSDTGMRPFDPPEWDRTFGEWITLPDRQ